MFAFLFYLKMEKKIRVIKEFEDMIDMAELKALSKFSLETPLTEKQTKRMLELYFMLTTS